MPKKYFSADFLRMLRNQVPIHTVITSFLNIEARNSHNLLRFRCPLCRNFHTAVNPQTNLARCFDCQENFNPIDMVMAAAPCSFIEAVQFLEDKMNQ
jgi:DNA primase